MKIASIGNGIIHFGFHRGQYAAFVNVSNEGTNWTDEALFEELRKIHASCQHIILASMQVSGQDVIDPLSIPEIDMLIARCQIIPTIQLQVVTNGEHPGSTINDRTFVTCRPKAENKYLIHPELKPNEVIYEFSDDLWMDRIAVSAPHVYIEGDLETRCLDLIRRRPDVLRYHQKATI